MASTRVSIYAPLLLVALLASSTLVNACISMNQPCGPAYWCCDCDPTTNYELYCDWVYDYKGFRCTTKAFNPRCRKLDESDIMSALNLPRKLVRSTSSFSTPQETVQQPLQ